jgi:magnesium transporter
MLKELLGPDIRELIQLKDYAGLKDGISEWEAPEIADLLLSLPEADQPILFRLLPRQKAAEVFAYLPSDGQKRLLQNLTAEHVRALLGALAPDDRTLLFGELPAQVTQQLLNLLPPEELKEARQLLGYPEESIGRLMTPEYVAIRPEWTIGRALEHIRLGYFENEIARAVVPALFIPLIISSGGNSGSQAASLVIRAMALEEIRLRDWWRVMRREIAAGVTLGAILGSIALVRIMLWPHHETLYGEHYILVALTVACSLIGIVLWGSLSGSMLPFIMRRLGFDFAASFVPFVATLVDVIGLVIYFSVAAVILHGTLL